MRAKSYIYPENVCGNLTDDHDDLFPRMDAQLTHQEHLELLGSDPDRWLVEWTYRVTEVISSLEDSGQFFEDLLLEYLRANGVAERKDALNGGRPLGLDPKYGLVEYAVGLYRRGTWTLQRTCNAIRLGLRGFLPSEPRLISKSDPAADLARATLWNNNSKK